MALINEGTGTMIGGGDFGMNLGTSAGIPAVPVTTPIAAPVTAPVAQPLTTETLPQGTFYGQQALQVISKATDYGFTGIGINQKGNGRFIHLDISKDSQGRPRPHVWSY